ncbi:uncharacterized protein LOC131681064 [Topomyia yanbarensis]|uniref:uncharacterized protein LOC131681064 n=1 Tax=Topomyia yanbarensis TaxID=2498891 RepID=UPI00273B76D0|nr:uncharacterized protein LOC131681064 [Topomyia yanbarensis]
MLNRELARTARMFNYDTEFVVQSATRCEAFEGETSSTAGEVNRCSRCDRPAHIGRQCPALNKNCRRCGKLGHFESCCRQKMRVDQLTQQNPIEPENEEEQV